MLTRKLASRSPVRLPVPAGIFPIFHVTLLVDALNCNLSPSETAPSSAQVTPGASLIVTRASCTSLVVFVAVKYTRYVVFDPTFEEVDQTQPVADFQNHNTALRQTTSPQFQYSPEHYWIRFYL